MDIRNTKQQLREESAYILNTVKGKEKRSQLLLEELVKSELLQNVQNVSIFVSMTDEVSSNVIVDYCWDNNIRISVPEYHHYSHGDVIDFREWQKDDELIETRHEIFHPRSGKLFSMEDIQLVFVPGLLFTPGGKRLGRGAGFYDRLLSEFNGESIGLCFEEQLKEDLPQDEHDQSVDRVVSC